MSALAGRSDAGPQVPGRADRMRGARLPGWLGLEGIPGSGQRSAASGCRPGCGKPTSCPNRSSRRPPRRRPGTTSTSRFQQMVEIVGEATANELRQRSLDIYRQGADFARERGIIVADTKFEWGRVGGELILDRRSADPGQFTFLAGRAVPARPISAVVRQAIRARLARRPPAGTRTARRPHCRMKSWPRRAANTSRLSSG